MRYITVRLLTLTLLVVVGGAVADAEGRAPETFPLIGQCDQPAIARIACGGSGDITRGSACANVAQRGRICCGHAERPITAKRAPDCAGGQCGIPRGGDRPRAIRVLRVVDCGDCQLVVLDVDGAICVLQPVEGGGIGGRCGSAGPRTRACGDACRSRSACGPFPCADGRDAPWGGVRWGEVRRNCCP